jgi:hypothetical protein
MIAVSTRNELVHNYTFTKEKEVHDPMRGACVHAVQQGTGTDTSLGWLRDRFSCRLGGRRGAHMTAVEDFNGGAACWLWAVAIEIPDMHTRVRSVRLCSLDTAKSTSTTPLAASIVTVVCEL